MLKDQIIGGAILTVKLCTYEQDTTTIFCRMGNIVFYTSATLLIPSFEFTGQTIVVAHFDWKKWREGWIIFGTIRLFRKHQTTINPLVKDMRLPG